MHRPGAFLTFALGDAFFPVRHGFKPDLGNNCHASGEKMTFRLSRCLSLLAGLLLLTSSWPSEARELSPLSVLVTSPSNPQIQAASTRRVNAPYFDGDVRFSETAIFWFGRVTPTENSVDVRVGYNDDHLYLRVAAFDRRLWYDTSPSPDDLTAWDAVTLYLDMNGNVGNAPDADAYRFDAQLVWWEARDNYQAAYVGDGSGWVTTTVSFTTTSFWRSMTGQPNDDLDDRAWALAYYIPFEGLGLSGPPAQGTVWGMALALHDRDDGDGTPIADKIWPETMESGQPVTWGQLAFGMPTYSPPPAVPGGTVTVRHGLDGATVVDADVGGSSVCGGPAWPDYFPTWGDLNYAGKEFLNIQNLGDVGDWPCFSRYYVTFPLDALPSGKVIISATLTLYQWGNAGEGYDPGPQPSLIQVLTVGQDWDESTLTWNNAPLALENVAAAWADVFPDWPGEPRRWDVSRAVAEAYAAERPLRLALYESDWAYHSGKYFHSSDTGDWNENRRPTLTVTWGRAVAELAKTAVPSSGDQGNPITYTLSFLGTGNTLTLTDTLPVGVSWNGILGWDGTSVAPTYDSDHHHLTWSGTPSLGQEVIISYTVTITTGDRQALVNTAELSEAGGDTSTATATVIANPYQAYLPLVLKGN